jgi:UDPglucose--hexose-1-phosphate uridylyltransferase
MDHPAPDPMRTDPSATPRERFDPAAHPHRRLNLLTGEWVLVSAHRSSRPWHGAEEAPPPEQQPSYDPDCHLCPGNARANGERNPDYRGTFVFDNDFPALMPDSPGPSSGAGEPLLVSAPATGTGRVICYSPNHSATLPDLDQTAVRAVVDCWCDQSVELGARHAHVQIFENKGAMMGCSSPHPHGQIWASDFVPTEVAREDERQRAWQTGHGAPLLAQVAERELAAGERVIIASEHWLVLVPWWASWPFETLLIARDGAARLEDLSPAARDDLAAVLIRLTRGYDALFGVSFPYSMGWHGAPHCISDTAHWRLHAHVFPPLLRSASVRKFMVGFEMLGEAQRDLTPEQAAERLRAAIDE